MKLFLILPPPLGKVKIDLPLWIWTVFTVMVNPPQLCIHDAPSFPLLCSSWFIGEFPPHLHPDTLFLLRKMVVLENSLAAYFLNPCF